MSVEKKFLVLAAVGLAVAGAVMWLSRASSEGELPAGAPHAAGKPAVKAEARRAGSRRVREGARGREESDKKRPDFSDASSDDEVSLSPEFKKVLADLQAALDADDWRATVRIVQSMQDSSEWPDGIPKALHMAAIDMLKWFGSRTAPELVGYLESQDSEIVESAKEAMLEALGDFSLSDGERSALMLGYIKVVQDVDTLDTMMFELNNMRPTVRADTALGIYESGNKAAIGVLEESLDFFFSEAEDYEVKGPEEIKRYRDDAERAYAEDPDQAESDEDFYGGDKD